MPDTSYLANPGLHGYEFYLLWLGRPGFFIWIYCPLNICNFWFIYFSFHSLLAPVPWLIYLFIYLLSYLFTKSARCWNLFLLFWLSWCCHTRAFCILLNYSYCVELFSFFIHFKNIYCMLLSISHPWRRKWQPIPIFLPEKSHGQRRLVGYSL